MNSIIIFARSVFRVPSRLIQKIPSTFAQLLQLTWSTSTDSAKSPKSNTSYSSQILTYQLHKYHNVKSKCIGDDFYKHH